MSNPNLQLRPTNSFCVAMNLFDKANFYFVAVLSSGNHYHNGTGARQHREHDIQKKYLEYTPTLFIPHDDHAICYNMYVGCCEGLHGIQLQISLVWVTSAVTNQNWFHWSGCRNYRPTEFSPFLVDIIIKHYSF